MNEEEPFYINAIFWRKIIIIAVLLVLVAMFWKPLSETVLSSAIIVSTLLRYKFLILNEAYRQAFLSELAGAGLVSIITFMKLLISLFLSWSIYHTTIFIVAQFILPVSTWEERKKAKGKLLSFMFGKHGPAIFIKDGKQIARKAAAESTRPGVILVDLSSAVVLSQQEDTQSWNLTHEYDKTKQSLVQWIRSKKKNTESSFTRVRGPGIVFTEGGEKIFSVIDLRKQSRGMKDVEAYTRNGIKIKSNVSVSFSLNDEPEAITVGYVSEAGHIDIRGLVVSESQSERQIVIHDVFVLDSQDAQEIVAFIHNGRPLTYPEKSQRVSNSPYQFFPNRVWAAAHAEARNSIGDCIAWHQIPIEIAMDLFRAKLSAIPYDDLFTTLEARTEFPYPTEGESQHIADKQVLKKTKDEFAEELKRRGVLSFQVLRRKDGIPFMKGETLQSNSVIRYPILAFSRVNSNILRKSGIVITSASFGQIRPKDPKIQLKMVENWKAKLDKEINLINAEYELEAVRVRNRNRAQIQQEMTYLLSSIFQSTHTEEALALRIFQALEAAATNPANEDVSPKEILAMLGNIHNWLLVERKDMADQAQPALEGHNSELG